MGTKIARASGNISVARFVRRGAAAGSGEYTVQQSVADQLACGVCHDGSQDSPIELYDLPNLDALGQPFIANVTPAGADAREIPWFPANEGNHVPICAGAAWAITTGPVYLKPDADARAIPAGVGEPYSAIAEENSGGANEYINCSIVTGITPA